MRIVTFYEFVLPTDIRLMEFTVKCSFSKMLLVNLFLTFILFL